MKFSTRHDLDRPAVALFDGLSDFPRIERILTRRGVAVARVDPAREPGVGLAWDVAFDWRERRRELRLDVTRFERPETLALAGRSEAFEIAVELTVIALSRGRSRLVAEIEVRPRTMRARLMLQTAKLGKPRLDRNFARRVAQLAEAVAAARA